MFRKSLFLIAIVVPIIVVAGNVYGQTAKKAKSSRTTNRTSGSLKSRVKTINDQTPADWNERQSQNPSAVVKQKTKNAIDAGFTLSDNVKNEAQLGQQSNGSTNQRLTGKTRRKKTTTQTNLLPYMEQQNVIKKKTNNTSGNSSGLTTTTRRAKSRKKYANQEVGYRRKPLVKN
jgi:hypothetical protein